MHLELHVEVGVISCIVPEIEKSNRKEIFKRKRLIYLRSDGNSQESVESVLREVKKSVMGKICRNDRI